MEHSTATLDGKGITRPPVAPVATTPADHTRVIFVTRFGLAVVGYVDKSGSEVRHA
jgi:hypothetical protein